MVYPNGVNHWGWFCQKVLPLVYDESLSYYEVLCKLTDFIGNLAQSESKLEDQMQALQTDWQEVQGQFTEITQQWADYKDQQDQAWAAYQQQIQSELQGMQETLEAIKNGEYVDLYLDSLQAYIDQNLQEMVAGIVKYVSFGLTKDGHFAAYIPQSWQFLEFSTIMDETSPLYGHLVLQW